jgi:hypothetical protein
MEICFAEMMEIAFSEAHKIKMEFFSGLEVIFSYNMDGRHVI